MIVFFISAEAHAKMWERLSLFVVLPAVAIASAITYKNEMEHHEPPPEFVPYEHMRIRKKVWPGFIYTVFVFF